jgi:hypothetical protein
MSLDQQLSINMSLPAFAILVVRVVLAWLFFAMLARRLSSLHY